MTLTFKNQERNQRHSSFSRHVFNVSNLSLFPYQRSRWAPFLISHSPGFYEQYMRYYFYEVESPLFPLYFKYNNKILPRQFFPRNYSLDFASIDTTIINTPSLVSIIIIFTYNLYSLPPILLFIWDTTFIISTLTIAIYFEWHSSLVLGEFWF